MASSSVFSETLQSITTAKLDELSLKRTTFDARRQEVLAELDTKRTPFERLETLVAGAKRCFKIQAGEDGDNVITGDVSSPRLESDLDRLDRFLEQARYDPSLSHQVLQGWEKTLLRYLDVQARKFEYATLYGQLVTEWLSAEKSGTGKTHVTAGEDTQMEESFDELPEKKRLEAREKFESSIFEPASVHEQAIKQYLEKLFDQEDKDISEALEELRKDVANFEKTLATGEQFNQHVTAVAIRGLLKSDQIAGQKRTVLNDFKRNHIILSEISDVLNMRFSALGSWSWGEYVPVEQRRKLNGSFNIYMHEDLLQAIFLQFIGVKWSVFFKAKLREFRKTAWKSNFKSVSRVERKRREYYLGVQETDETLQRIRRRKYRQGYFLYHLLNSDEQEIEMKDGEEEAELDLDEGGEFEGISEEAFPVKRKMGGRGLGKGGAMRHRKIHVAKLDDEESDDGSIEEYSMKQPMEKKQDLLHMLSTEAAVNKRVHGSFSAFRSTFSELHNSLPHAAILTVLSHFGVSKKWRNFFTTYLEAPLRFDDDSENTAVRKRKRGAPASHTLTDAMSETLLFCLDFSVNRETGGDFLHRLSDDFWFWSHDYSMCAKSWSQVQLFSKSMGLPLNDKNSGAVSIGNSGATETTQSSDLPTGRIRWGMLVFDGESLRFKIDQKMVDSHIEELRKQLDAKSKSIFDWTQVWNTYANTFFASNFGRAANCFGRAHVDEILATHQRIQQSIFDGGDVVQYLRNTIERRFDIKNLADGFLFFPVELGGLALQSPFVSPLQIRDSVVKDPSIILDDFEKNEREEYAELKEAFDKGEDLPASRNGIADPKWKTEQGADEFMPFEEYTRFREQFTTQGGENYLLMAYQELLGRPAEDSIECSEEVTQAIEALKSQAPGSKGITHDWRAMDAYWKWMAQLYGPDMVERFDGLSIVDPSLLPIGMVGLFRDRRVRWQG